MTPSPSKAFLQGHGPKESAAVHAALAGAQLDAADVQEFADKRNALLDQDTERQLRLAHRDAWLGQICRKVAWDALAYMRGPAVEVRLPAKAAVD